MSTLYLDLETEWLTHADAVPKFVVAGYAYDDGPVAFDNSRSGLVARVTDHVRNGGLLVCHRGAFEAGTLGLPADVSWYDTAMAATIMGAEKGDADAASHSLKSLAKKAGYDHAGGKGRSGLQGSFKQGVAPTEEQLQYLRQDVEATRAVYKWQRARWENIPDLERQTRWSRDVFALGRRGLHIDTERLGGLIRESKRAERELEGLLKGLGIIQPRGPKKDPWRKQAVSQDVVQGLLAAAGVTEKTKGVDGEESELLVRDRVTLMRTGDPRLKVLAEYYGKQKWVGLLEAYENPWGVVRARYNSIVATGRMSCSAPNVQQVTKRGGLRECFIPSPGHVFVEADYAMLELYCFVDTCARWGIPSRMLNALNEGLDVHTIVAANPAVGTRDLAKVFNYGGLGGMGPDTMQVNIEKQLGIVMPVPQIRAAMDGWLATWPEVQAYWKHNTTRPHPAGFKRDKWGVMKMTYKYLAENPQSGRRRLAYYCAAQNFGFQGPGGDIIKRAIELCNADGEAPVAALHDQLLCEVEDTPAAIHYRSQRLGQLMKQAGEEICPNVRWPEVKVHVFKERWSGK